MSGWRLLRTLDFGPLPLISLRSAAEGQVVACSYSRDAESRSGAVKVFSAGLEQLLEEQLSSACFFMDLLPDGRTVLHLADGRLALFSAAERRLDYERVANDCMITDSAFLPDNRLVFTDSKGRLTLFDRQQGAAVHSAVAHSLRGQEVSAWCCAAPEPNLVLSGGDDCHLKATDLRSGSVCLRSACFEGGVVRVRPSARPNLLLTGSYDQSLREFDLRSLKEPVASVPVSSCPPSSALQLRGDPWDFELAPDGSLAVACMYGGWALLDPGLTVLSEQELPGALVYGVHVQSGDPPRLLCTSFTDGRLHQFEQQKVL